MKKDKKRIREAFVDALVELACVLLFFGIGAVVVGLFGAEPDWLGMDMEWIALIGFLVSLLLFGMICGLVKCVKKLRRKKHK